MQIISFPKISIPSHWSNPSWSQNSFCHNKWEVALEHSPIWNILLTRCNLLPKITGIIRLDLLLFMPQQHTDIHHYMGRTSSTSGNHAQMSKLAKLKNELGKCQFFKQHLNYLWHFITKQGIQSLPEKLIAITNLKEPNSMDELCHFLGLIRYNRRFIPLFSAITKPLHKLLKRTPSSNAQHSISQLLNILKKQFMWNLSYSTPTLNNHRPYSLMQFTMPTLESSLRQLKVLMV